MKREQLPKCNRCNGNDAPPKGARHDLIPFNKRFVFVISYYSVCRSIIIAIIVMYFSDLSFSLFLTLTFI